MADYLESRGSLGSRIPMEAPSREATQPKQRPAMMGALEDIEAAEKNLADRLNLLANRLSPVLHVRPTDAVNGKASSESCGAHIPDVLFNHANVLRAHARQIQELIDSLAI